VDHDVAVAASAEPVDLLGQIAAGDGGVSAVGDRERAREHHLASGVECVGVGIVGGVREVAGHALVRDPAHDVQVRARVKLAPPEVFRGVVGQVPAELEELGVLGGDHAVERVVEHARYQPAHGTPWSLGRGTFARTDHPVARI
jgi:hypothetical protein